MAKKTATAEIDQPTPFCADGCGNRVGSAKSTFLQGHDQRLISDLSFRVVDGEMGTFQRALLTLVEDPKPADGAYTYIETGDIMDRINAVSAAVAARFSAPLADKFTSAAMAKWDKAVKRSAAQADREARRAVAAIKKNSGESPATKAVFRRLQAPDGQPNSVDPIGASFTLDDPAAFRNEATMYLADKSNLKTATIKNADWAKIHEYFASGLVAADTAPAPITGSPEAKTSTVGQEIQNLRGSVVKVKVGRWTYDAVVVGMNQAGKITAVEYTDKKGNEKTTDRFELVVRDAAAPELRKLMKLQ